MILYKKETKQKKMLRVTTSAHLPVVSCKYWNGSAFLLKVPNQHSSEFDHERQKRSLYFESQDQVALTPETVDELPRALPIQM